MLSVDKYCSSGAPQPWGYPKLPKEHVKANQQYIPLKLKPYGSQRRTASRKAKNPSADPAASDEPVEATAGASARSGTAWSYAVSSALRSDTSEGAVGALGRLISFTLPTCASFACVPSHVSIGTGVGRGIGGTDSDGGFVRLQFFDVEVLDKV